MSAPLKKAPYFKDICLFEYNDILKSFGYDYINDDSLVGVRFLKNDCFFEISYYPEDFPNYIPIFYLGYNYTTDNNTKPIKKITNIWSFIPDDYRHSISYKKFSNEVELKIILKNVLEKYFFEYLAPVLKNESILKEKIINDEIDSKNIEKKNTHMLLKKKAETAFFARRYSDAIELYSKIEEMELTVKDRKHIIFAKQYLKRD